MNILKPFCITVLAMVSFHVSAQQFTELLRDAKPDNPGTAIPYSYLNGYYYFAAYDTASKGTELFRTDGTPGGTHRIKDINTAPETSDPAFHSMGNNLLNNLLFFVASDGIHGRELWRTDGTAQGTFMVKDIYPGTGDSRIIEFRPFKNVLYFGANDGIHGHELWRTDGTEAGTYMVADLANNALNTGAGNFLEFNNELYYSVWDSTASIPALYRTDGTAAGTVFIRRFSCSQGTTLNGYHYFAGDDVVTSPSGYELWKWDGTASGFTFLKEMNPGVLGSFPGNFHTINNTVIYEASSPAAGHEFWRSDGTPAGTGLLKDIYPGNISGVRKTSFGSVRYRDRLYFTGMDNSTGIEVWSTDGTGAGTTLLRNIGSSGSSFFPAPMGVVNDRLIIQASVNGNTVELWKSDGTSAGTLFVKMINATDRTKLLKGAVASDSTLYFTADNGTNGYELWKTDGTAAGTIMVKDLVPGSKGASPELAGMIGNKIIFSATDSLGDKELWISDGTATGTVLLRNINTGTKPANPLELTPVNHALFFTAENGINTGRTLWRTDGTDTGTYQVKQINPSGNANVAALTELGGNLVFRADNGISGIELWRSDGTDTGTYQVKDIYPGSSLSFPGGFARLNNKACFDAREENGRSALWITDGTQAGTIKLKNIKKRTQVGTYDAVYRNELFFSAEDSLNETELWKTNGTPAGTILVKNMAGTNSSFPEEIVLMGDALYVNARNDTSVFFYDLWQSDGTPAGTIRLKPNALLADVRLGMAAVNNRLVYCSNDGNNDTPDELWACDSTGQLTLLKTMNLGRVTDRTLNYVAYNNYLYFRGNDGVSGDELWKTDGTVPGTVQVADLAPGPQSSGAKLYFTPGAPFALVHANTRIYAFTDTATTNPTGLTRRPVRENQFILYPNPAGDVVHISGAVTGKVKVTVIDLLGRFVYEHDYRTGEEITIPAASFPSGLYYVNIAAGSDRECKPLMIAK